MGHALLRLGPLLRTLTLLPILASGGCVTDPFCRAHNAAEFTPSAERYRAMPARERLEDAERFNVLARRCNWEP